MIEAAPVTVPELQIQDIETKEAKGSRKENEREYDLFPIEFLKQTSATGFGNHKPQAFPLDSKWNSLVKQRWKGMAKVDTTLASLHDTADKMTQEHSGVLNITPLVLKKEVSRSDLQAPIKETRTTTRPAIVSIKSIIGSSTSKILDWIEDRSTTSDDVIVIREPSEIWESIQINSKSLLDLFYANQCEYGLVFQLLYSFTMERQLQRATREHADKRVGIDMRSPLSAKELYYDSMDRYHQGEIQAQVYQKLFEGGGRYLYPNQMILLDKPPNLGLGRVSGKDWKINEVVTEKYLEESRTAYKKLRGQSTSNEFLELNGNIRIEQMAESIEQLIEDQKQRLISDDVVMRFPEIVSVERNVGAGKNKLLDEIKTIIDRRGITSIRIIKEPVEERLTITQGQVSNTDSDYENSRRSIFDWFYCDPTKYAMVLQTLIYRSTMINLRREAKEHPEVQIILCERSLRSSKLVFGKILYEEGYLDEAEYKVLDYLLQEEETEWMYPEQAIYLETDVETCLNRIQQHERKSEEIIDIEWLEKCQKYHERMWDETKDTHETYSPEYGIRRWDSNQSG
jgi:deoxyadenosine/deoxycytidine kinase